MGKGDIAQIEEANESTVLISSRAKLNSSPDSTKVSLWRRNWLPCVPKRYIMVVLSFLGFCNVYAMRVNLSMAIVVMVNDSSHPETPSRKSYHWTATEQGWLLAAFFCGYIVTQVPGGWLAGRYGAKYIYGIGIVMTAVFTLLTPLAADVSIWLLVAVRVLEGLFEGVTFPASHSLWGRWAPPSERSRLLTFIYSGQYVGNIISFPVTALLCRYGFAGGWPSAFYVCGSIGIIWFIFWLLFAYDSPSTHPSISMSERKYIENAIAEIESETRHVHVPTPWLQIFSSPAVLGVVVAQFSSNYGFYVLLTTMPTYFKQAIGFDIRQDLVMNGVFSAIPYVCETAIVLAAGPLADLIRAKLFSATVTRKLFTCTSLSLQATFLLLCAYLGTTKITALLFLSLAIGIGGVQIAGHSVTIIEMAPRFAGVIMGVVNSFGTLPGIIGPIITKQIAHASDTERQLLIEEWRSVFILAAEVSFFGAAIFAILGDSSKQSWANGPRIRGRTPLILPEVDSGLP